MVPLCCWSLYLKDSKNWIELRDFKLGDGRMWPWKLRHIGDGCMCFVWLCAERTIPKRDMTAATGPSIIRWWTLICPSSADKALGTLLSPKVPLHATIKGHVIDVCLFLLLNIKWAQLPGWWRMKTLSFYVTVPVFCVGLAWILCTVWRIITQMKWRFRLVTFLPAPKSTTGSPNGGEVEMK